MKKVPSVKYRSWIEIDLGNLEENYNHVRKNTDSCICCVIKANAYGHGAVQVAKLYQRLGAGYLAVSNIEEALQLRQNGIVIPILILGYTSWNCAKILADNNITQCIYSYEYGIKLAKQAEEFGVKVKAHIKIDTGMGRIGFLCRDTSETEIEKAIQICKEPSLEVEGLFMHFAVADEGLVGEQYTREQFQSFMRAIEIFYQHGISFIIKHCANSAAIFEYPEMHLDMVRAGVVLYGLKPSGKVEQLPKLKPAMSFHSVISYIKQVKKGQSVSYGRTFIAEKDKKIATIPVGYADGFRRMNGNAGYSLLVNGCLAPIVGRVCMDQLMVDVTEIDCKIGDEVIVFGEHSGHTVDDIAYLNNTINYEIVCNVGERVPRAFVYDGEIFEWTDNLYNNY